MAYLVKSLHNLRAEIDQHWPKRDRRTDGWYASPKVRKSYGHNPDAKGAVHAIDVDRDGLDPKWLISNVRKSGHVLWYVIYNRTLWSNTYQWKPRAYHGPNPHTDHLHFEVYRDSHAENYNGRWDIGAAGGGSGSADVYVPPYGAAGPAPGMSELDYTNYLRGVASSQTDHARGLLGYRDAMRNLRR